MIWKHSKRSPVRMYIIAGYLLLSLSPQVQLTTREEKVHQTLAQRFTSHCSPQIMLCYVATYQRPCCPESSPDVQVDQQTYDLAGAPIYFGPAANVVSDDQHPRRIVCDREHAHSTLTNASSRSLMPPRRLVIHASYMRCSRPCSILS